MIHHQQYDIVKRGRKYVYLFIFFGTELELSDSILQGQKFHIGIGFVHVYTFFCLRRLFMRRMSIYYYHVNKSICITTTSNARTAGQLDDDDCAFLESSSIRRHLKVAG